MMQASNVKRFILFFLFLALLGVWGNNLYRIMPRRTVFRITEENNPQADKRTLGSNGNHIPVLSYTGDPFEPFFRRPDSVAISTVEVIPLPPEPPPSVLFLGLVGAERDASAIILLPNGLTEIVNEGDEIAGIKITGIDDEILKFRFKGKSYTKALGQGR